MPRTQNFGQARLDQLLRVLLQVGALPDPTPHRPDIGAMGTSEVQIPTAPSAAHTSVARPHRAATTIVVCSLAAATREWLNNGSRMRWEPHVRFCERLAVRLRRATHRNIYVRSEKAGHRVMTSLTRFIEGRLKLQVNAQKSAVARPWQRSFLGFTVTDEPQGHGDASPTRPWPGSKTGS